MAPEKRHSFIHNGLLLLFDFGVSAIENCVWGFFQFPSDFVSGQKVFEWDQTLDEVNMYINLPPNVHAKQFYCKVQSKHVEVGIKGNPPYLNVCFSFPFAFDSCFVKWVCVGSLMHLIVGFWFLSTISHLR